MRSAIAVVLCLPLVVTGCSLNPTAAPAPDAGLAIAGAVHGGQQPIVGAHVYLLSAGTEGYAGPGVAASSANVSNSLLNVGSTGHADSIGAYVLTGAGGSFGISGDYSCTPNTQVYLYALGGDAGAGPNNAAALMAVLGNCPSSGNFMTATPYVVVNEVSTVAAAFAFAGFATDATHVSSSGTTLAQVDIQNAFANAANLASLSTGTALATTPNGNGTPPQSEINLLANILAACVNTNGSISGPTNATPCYTLLNSALSGGTSGTAPAETATAAINIAHNPWANVTTLYNLPTPQAPFGPALAGLPNDLTVSVEWTGGGLFDPYFVAIDGAGNAWVTNNNNSVTEFSSSGSAVIGSPFTGGGLDGANGIAIDPSGNAWIANFNGNSVTELSGTTGAAVSGSPFTGGGMNNPYGVAIDGAGNVWITNINKNAYSVTKLSNTGAAASGSPFTGGGLSNPRSIAIDGTGNAWIASIKDSTITKLSNAGVILSGPGYTGGGLSSPYSIAIDATGDAWIANNVSNGLTNVSEFSNSGTALSGSAGYTGGGVNISVAIAIDGAGNAWVGNDGDNTISELSNAGAGISPPPGYVPAGINEVNGIAVDGSGNVWITDPSAGLGNQITEVIGAATPVVTPLSVGVQTNTLGTRP